MGISQVFIYILIALFGLSVGSFLNVIILRFDDLKSIIVTRSRCPHCKKVLPWYELIPFFSYIILVGRCRGCKKLISYQYPLVELVTAFIFVLIFHSFGFSLDSLLLILVFSTLIVIAVYDIIHSEIPDLCSYFAIFFALIWLFYWMAIHGKLESSSAWLSYGYGLLVGVGFFGLLVLFSRQKWMGAGDILIGAVMGIILGFPQIIFAIFLAFIIGAIVSLILMATKQKTLKDAVPFAPFLILATLIVFFWGEHLLNWYWNILL